MGLLEKKVSTLPPEQQQEVQAFVDYLLEKAKRRSPRKLKLDWAGALSHLRDQYTSVDLQHEALRQWTNEIPSR